MILRHILLIISLEAISAKINIDILSNQKNVEVDYEGIDVKVITDREIVLFGINKWPLRNAVKEHFGREADHVLLATGVPWGRIHQNYCWEPVSVVTKVKSATVKDMTTEPVILTTHDFDNESNNTIKVNAGINQSIRNTIRTIWTKNQQLAASLSLKYEVNLLISKVSAVAGFSYTHSWGESHEQSQTVTVGTSSSVEMELRPGQSATAALSANRGNMEVEIVYESTLRGNVAVTFQDKFRGHYHWAVPIEKVMRTAGIRNIITTEGILVLGFHTDAKLKVYDKVTGMLL